MSIQTIEGKDFDSIIASKEDVLVNFSAPWCGPCKSMAPTLEAFATEHAETLKVVKVDIDEDFDLAAQFNVRGVPTLILFHNGKPVNSVSGAQSKSQLEKLVTQYKG